jgi:outer membrane biosynthesis protein TonB
MRLKLPPPTVLPALAGLVFAALLQTQCSTSPPYVAGPQGVSLDSGPRGGVRGQAPTRYLNEVRPPDMPGAGLSQPPMIGPVYETPDDLAGGMIPTEPPLVPDPPVVPEPPTVATTPEPPEPPPPAPTPKPQPQPQPETLPFGIPVQGKKGWVYSPYDREQLVDVTGIASGKKVRCPWTSKIFLVP